MVDVIQNRIQEVYASWDNSGDPNLIDNHGQTLTQTGKTSIDRFLAFFFVACL